MRYTDPFDLESPEDAANTPPPEPHQGGDADVAPPAQDEPVAAGGEEEPGIEPAPAGAAPEPPLWNTADDHVLHLPPQTVERILVALPWLRRWWRPGMRPSVPPLVRPGVHPGVRPAVFGPRRKAIGAIGQLVRRAKWVGTRRTRSGRLPIFRSRAGGRSFRIAARPRAGLRYEIVSIEPELGGMEGELEQRAPGAPPAVRARILWPALGFPAVVTPHARPAAQTMRDGDATRCVCLLVLTDHPALTSALAAQYLRYVPWDKRGRRHIRNNPAASFPAAAIVVERRGMYQNRRDNFGQHVRFGTNGSNQNGITALLSKYVTDFYGRSGLKHLYEIRVSETATAGLAKGQYQLFWNNEQANESLPSDEMAQLLGQYARPNRARIAKGAELDFLVKEYRYEYGGLHSPYNQGRSSVVPSEILHPLFIERPRDAALRIGHVTDTHVDVRADVYEANLEVARNKAREALRRNPRAQLNEGDRLLANGKGVFNNFNRSFEEVYRKARENSDVLLLTGDLIDYGRGFWGVGRPAEVQVDSLYHADRNWFLFYYFLASGSRYSRPAYTILGNHDWRLNPYPPFAPGAPSPNELLHDHRGLKEFERKNEKKREQSAIVAVAHGPGYKRGFSYTTDAETTWELVKKEFPSAVQALVKLFSQASNLEQRGSPIETSVESIAWYLLSINPFLDYTFTLPGKQSVLMLDWAKDEIVLHPQVRNGVRSGYNPLMPGDAAGTPRPANNPTPLQERLVDDFLSGPSRAKIVGVHAPVVCPYGNWYDADLLNARVTYKDPAAARGPAAGHPIFAATPTTASGAPFGIVADRGSLGRDKARDALVKKLADSRHSVRMVLSGHVHRNALLVAFSPRQKVVLTNPKDSFRNRPVTGALLVRRVPEQMVRAANPPAVTIDTIFTYPEAKRGPLYILTTSAGPRGSFEARPLTEKERETGITTDPGYAHAELASDGTIRSVRFLTIDVRAIPKITPPVGVLDLAAPGVGREVEELVAGTW